MCGQIILRLFSSSSSRRIQNHSAAQNKQEEFLVFKFLCRKILFRIINMSLSLRTQVLTLYRKILHLSRTWESKDPTNNIAEKAFIKNEAKSLFRQNKTLEDPEAIRDCLREAEARVTIALHYRNPYPRPVNLPPKSLAIKKGKEQGAAQERLKKQARPIYIKSIDSKT